eukprot:346289-Chlamydomonas_euryale.AAC.3
MTRTLTPRLCSAITASLISSHLWKAVHARVGGTGVGGRGTVVGRHRDGRYREAVQAVQRQDRATDLATSVEGGTGAGRRTRHMMRRMQAAGRGAMRRRLHSRGAVLAVQARDLPAEEVRQDVSGDRRMLKKLHAHRRLLMQLHFASAWLRADKSCAHFDASMCRDQAQRRAASYDLRTQSRCQSNPRLEGICGDKVAFASACVDV